MCFVFQITSTYGPQVPSATLQLDTLWLQVCDLAPLNKDKLIPFILILRNGRVYCYRSWQRPCNSTNDLEGHRTIPRTPVGRDEGRRN